jgi:flagellar biosynthesis protein FlhF
LNALGKKMEQTSSMKIKSYFAASVEQAVQEARQELGAEAMLITSRRSSPETRSLGAYEVVFGLNAPSVRPRPAVPSADLSGELQHLRAQLQEIKSSLQGARPIQTPSSDAEELLEELVSNDLARNIAQVTISSAVRLREHLSRDPSSSLLPLRAYAAELISKRLHFAAPFQRLSSPPTSGQQPPSQPAAPGTSPVVVFVGPAGAGKTTTLIKIAIRECLAHRQPVRILSVDPYRVAAHEKLRSFAGIIGVGFNALNSIQEFSAAVEESRGKSFVLVDTPGYSPAEMDSAQELASCLSRLANKQTHLVLPASMKRTDLSRSIRDYAEFQADYLLFTKLDETGSQGAILSTALEADKPLSFFTTGQNIPEDIEPAQGRALVAAVLRPEVAEAVSAA